LAADALAFGRSEAGFGCVAHQLITSGAAGDALALAGVKIGLWCCGGCLGIGRSEDWLGLGCLRKGHLRARGLISWVQFSGRAFSCPDW
jgi:hypothetical protein